MAARPLSLSQILAPVAAGLRKVRSFALAVALLAALAAVALISWRLYEVRRDNATIAALKAGEDVEIDLRSASDELLMARSAFLLARDRHDDAQALLDTTSNMKDPKLRAKLLYNHANARVRDGMELIQRGEMDKAIPLTRLAKEAYRLALRLDPEAWDIKHNYDVAMRIVRDFPGSEAEDEEVPPDAPKRLWTDLPGVPKGLP